jgi:hypothetical protein
MAHNHRKGLYVLYSLLSHCFALRCNLQQELQKLFSFNPKNFSCVSFHKKNVLVCPQGYTSAAVALNLKNSCKALLLTWRRTTGKPA